MQADAVLGGLAAIPPGPELAAALASVELAAVPNNQVVDVLQAQARQLAHDQARLLAAMVEVGRTTPDAEPGAHRAEQVYPWAGGEIAAALTLTPRSADRELEFAETLVLRLPAVFAAMWAGRIDRAKAWVFADHLHPLSCGLTPEQIDTICTRLVPPAAGWTTRQLTAHLLRAIIAIDPDHARRRYDKAVRERQVIGYLAPDGTVTITATGLPTDEAAAACERLEQLAAAVKRAGHPGRLAQIQADLFLGMLDGRYHHLAQADIISDLLARAGGEDNAGPVQQTPEPDQPTQPGEPTVQPDEPNVEPHEATTEPGEGTTEPAAPMRAGVEIRVGLATLLGLDDQPGEIPGLGPVLAQVARATVSAQQRGPEWRFAVTDACGYLLLAGVTRRRPQAGQGGRCRGGVVEIHIPAPLLEQLTANPALCGPWAGVVTDIAAQYARRDEITAALDSRPGDRFARAALARHIQVRDRTCAHPGCRRPARKSDLDHTRDYARGGPTTRANTGPGCDRHHLIYKHEFGWQLRQPKPGHFEWTSPLGRVYRTRGEPIAIELPEPQPRAQAHEPDSEVHHDQPTILRLPPPDAEPQPPPPPAAFDNDEPPY